VTLSDGALHLGEPVEKRSYRRPVDDFFRSLAREQKEKAIIVVLSGMGTNGTAGAQAIKAVGGLCIAQDPETAEFPSMPRSLIHAGYADQVLNTADIPAVLLRFTQHPYLEPDPKGRARAQQELERHRQRLTDIIDYVRERTGHNFGPYKVSTVLRRIQRRMGLLGATELEEYQAHIRKHPAEAAALANDLMINVTGFFRDPEAWEALRIAVVRPLVEQRAVEDQIRAWVTACASGEEAYSLAMLIAEEADRAGKKFDVKIFVCLDANFTARPQLNRTFEVVVASHAHVDHTRSLPMIAESYSIRRLYHDGVRNGGGAIPIRTVLARLPVPGRVLGPARRSLVPELRLTSRPAISKRSGNTRISWI
jgi:two-component system CheB/CheR fusion protein